MFGSFAAPDCQMLFANLDGALDLQEWGTRQLESSMTVAHG